MFALISSERYNQVCFKNCRVVVSMLEHCGTFSVLAISCGHFIGVFEFEVKIQES